jgi:putative hydrolases of HD superfamily
MAEPKQMIAFLTFAEGLKNVLRHSYTSAGRRESVAEHTWMLCLMAMLVFDEIALEVDQLRVLKMLVIHDLPEIITGDIPTFDKHSIAAQAQQDELEAMQQLVAALPPELRQHILDLHREYEARVTPEARLAYAIDKAEALMQHNAADISTWDQNDYDYQTDFDNPRTSLYSVDPFMQALKRQIDLDTLAKIKSAGQLHRARADSVNRLLSETDGEQ